MILPYLIREINTNFKRNILMNITSITTMAILIIIFGFFIITVDNFEYLLKSISQNLQIVTRLEEHLSKNEIKKIHSKIAMLPNVEGVVFVSKEEAFIRLQKKLNKKISLTDIKYNPLPNYFEIKIDKAENIPLTALELKKIAGIKKVIYSEGIVEKIISLDTFVSIVGLTLIIILFISTLFVVGNTIRLTVYARRKEIKIMQLVGAENWFIRWPFILEGTIQGLLGGFVALLIIFITYPSILNSIKTSLPFLSLPPAYITLKFLPLFLPLSGLITGTIGGLISVNKFLED